ncbi:hypothetical protein ACIOD2_21780 [Amycolatopsis sp. NPDC088138]|uniref:hypothetical protein n=1 Tax=Amycolatopsis sp. NPDC088138 TaxID=3363938 RepID=UPI0037F6B063
MAWECSDCNAREDEKEKVVVDAVCHHCGKPLCRDHQVIVGQDEAFAPAAPEEPALRDRSAVHCESCRRTHHSRATLLEGLPT